MKNRYSRIFTLRAQLLILATVPVIGLIVFAAWTASDRISVQQETAQLERLIDYSVIAGNLVHELQRERGRTAGYYGAPGNETERLLRTQRGETDTALQTYADENGALATGVDDAEFNRLIDTIDDLLDRLATTRSNADDRSIPLDEAIGFYTTTNGTILDAVRRVTVLIDDADLSRQVSAYAHFLLGKERTGIERALLNNTFAQDRFGEGIFERFLGLVAEQETYLDVFQAMADEESFETYERIVSGESVDEVERLRGVARERAASGGFGVDAEYWFDMITAKIDLQKNVEDTLAETLQANAEAANLRATRDAILVTVVTAVLLILTIVITVLLSRGVLRQVGGEPTHVVSVAEQFAQGDIRLGEHEGVARSGIYLAMVELGQRLGSVIQDIISATDNMTQGSNELGQTSQQLSSGATEQAASAEQVSASMEQMGANIQQNADNASQTEKISLQVSRNAA
ncbi:MAG: nitrate- and nitrite sensing domain-containing protein, partial [Spirochaetota bacterium]